MRRIVESLRLAGFVVAAFLLTLVPGGVWAGLLTVNLRTGISTPWSAPVVLILVWLAWRCVGGEPPWRRSETRRSQRRANRVSPRVLGWALTANAFALAALAALWVILGELVKMPGNPLPDFSAYPLPIVGLVFVAAAIVGAVSEEVGLRGYLQGRLERLAPWPVAVLLMALIAAPGHALTQGFVWPTLLFYGLADLNYGVTAYLTRSILPGLISHATGLFVFFTFIWPADGARPHVSAGSAPTGFWILVAQMAACAGLAFWAFSRLGETMAPRDGREPLRV